LKNMNSQNTPSIYSRSVRQSVDREHFRFHRNAVIRFHPKWLLFILIVLPLMAHAQDASVQSSAARDRAFWQAIVKQQYAVPKGESPFSLVKELGGLLGSPDPELRDNIAYTIIAVWIVYRPVLSEAQLFALLDQWLANLRNGIGESGTDTVLERSFSTVCLAALAERDLKMPFLGDARYRRLLDAALVYLAAERDLRGYDPAKGWMHATAHTADFLKDLGGNPLLTRADQHRVLIALADRLSSAGQVFSQGEQDRLAQVAVAIVLRRDFDTANFDIWITRLRDTIRQAWRTSPLTSAALATAQTLPTSYRLCMSGCLWKTLLEVPLSRAPRCSRPCARAESFPNRRLRRNAKRGTTSRDQRVTLLRSRTVTG
jgi:uncharacterized protein DUF2785